MAALEATGIFKTFVPRKFGGYELGVTEFIDLILPIGEACASTAWVTSFYMEHNWLFSTNFPDSLVEEIYENQAYIMAPGSVNPDGGSIRPVDGGFALSGRWRYASGAVHGDWAIITAFEEGSKTPLPRVIIVPREDLTIEDTWRVSGMRATGSHDIVADGVFVDRKYVAPFPPPWRKSDANRHFDYYQLPVTAFLSIAASAPLIGASKRALAIFQEITGKRIKVGSRTIQNEKTSAQLRLAHASAEVEKAELVLRAMGKEMEAISIRGRMASGREMSRMRMMIAHAIRDCRTAVQQIIEGTGSAANFEGSELGRIHHDLQTGSGHTMFDLDASGEMYGKALIKSFARKQAN